MKIRHLAAAIAAVSTAVAVTASSTAHAEPRGFQPPSDSLRSYASQIGLRVGVAVNPEVLADEELAGIAADEFSSLTPENEMKWETVEPTRGTYDWSGADEVVDFARAHGQKVRGHTLLWHNQNPAWLTEGVDNGTISKDELRAILEKHITDEVRHFRGKVYQWDVANEFFADSWSPNPLPNGMNGDNFWVKHLGTGIVADAFRWAHAADPKAQLFYNDYNIAGEDGNSAKSTAVYNWAKELLAQGVPIHGIGNQGHLDTQYGFSGQRFRADLQRYADLGLKVAVTEADVRTFVDSAETQVPTDNLALFAHPYEFSQMLQACLAVRACTSFTVWGIDDTHSWVPGWFEGQGYALLWDVNKQPKEAYTTLKQDLRLALGAARRH